MCGERDCLVSCSTAAVTNLTTCSGRAAWCLVPTAVTNLTTCGERDCLVSYSTTVPNLTTLVVGVFESKYMYCPCTTGVHLSSLGDMISTLEESGLDTNLYA